MSTRRKPTVILRPLSWLTNQDAVWGTIRILAGGPVPIFTTREIARRVQCGPTVITRYLSRLVTAGIVERVTPAQVKQGATYRLLRDVGVEPPRVTPAGLIDDTPTDQERIWQAMKALPSFCVADLQASTGIVSTSAVQHYVRDLARAGYLTPLHRPSARQLARYRLVPSRNTGPRAPAVRRSGAVFDLNLGRQVWPEVKS